MTRARAGTRLRLPALVLMALMAAPAWAHGLLIAVRGDGAAVAGTVFYSDGSPGTGTWVELFDAAAPDAAAALAGVNAGKDGAFRFEATPGRRYRVVAHGEEGHSVASELELVAGARGRFVETDAAPAQPGWRQPPAWALIGGALLLSAIPALWLRARQRRAGRQGL